jgi:hypothetical protein
MGTSKEPAVINVVTWFFHYWELWLHGFGYMTMVLENGKKKNQRTTFITLLVLSRTPPVLWSRWNNWNWRFFDSDSLAKKLEPRFSDWNRTGGWWVVHKSKYPANNDACLSMSHLSLLIIIHYCFSTLIFYSFSSRVIFLILWFFIKKNWLTFFQRFEFQN